MFSAPRSDLWTVGLVPLSIEQLTAQRLVEVRDRILWMPDPGPWRYCADPFALQDGHRLQVFVEAYDYRTKHGVIEHHEIDLQQQRWSRIGTALAQPFHLSYPFVFRHQGRNWMIPESAKAGEIALYSAGPTLLDWQRECALLPGVPGVDATVIQHDGRWWMFFAIYGKESRDRRELHMAWADELHGPWQTCGNNPIHTGLGNSRPAGTPWVAEDGSVRLPVQDCRGGYGVATSWLRLTDLSPQGAQVEVLPDRLTGAMASTEYVEGLHTVAACGEWTLIDVKRIERGRYRQWLDIKRRLRRVLGQTAR